MGMLNTPPWRYYPLTLQFLAQQHSELPRGELLLLLLLHEVAEGNKGAVIQGNI